jgi:hypothetical protein
MDDEYEEEAYGWNHPSAHVRKIDFLIVGVDLLRKTAGVAEEVLANVTQLLCMHANYQQDQQSFADSVRREIETLTQEE